MAQRRMFSLDIVSSDAFLDMPISTQALYFHLGMAADDDGFVGNPKRVLRMTGTTDDDFKLLIAKRFILSFKTGVIVIKHWLQNNLIRADLYKETNYKNEKNLLGLNENGSYTELREGVSIIKQIRPPIWLKRRKGKTVRKRTENGTQSAHRIGKDRIGKDRIGNRERDAQINFLDNKEFQKELKEIFPNILIEEEIEKMKDWLLSKGERRKDYAAFARNWLRKVKPEEKEGVLIVRE